MVGGFANITIAAIRLVNNMIFANMDAFKIAVEQAMDSSKELLRMGAIMQERLNRQRQILGNLKSRKRDRSTEALRNVEKLTFEYGI
jgi:hypothetical protein